MRPQISIITPYYNTAPWIGQAVESVFSQQGAAWELLLIDDGSDDGSRDIAAGYAVLNGSIRTLDNRGRKGAGGARNTGLAVARGEAVLFLDSDDVLLPGALAGLYHAFRAARQPLVRGLGTAFCLQRLMLFEDAPFPPEHAHPLAPAREFCLNLYDRAWLANNGLEFPEDCLIGQDSVFLCRAHARLAASGAVGVPAVNVPVSLYRVNHKHGTPSPVKAQSYLLQARYCRAACEEHGLTDWLPLVIEHNFLSHWLMHVHTMRQESEETARRYLEDCLELFRGLESELEPAFARNLGSLGGACLECCAAGDAAGLLALLEHGRLLRPVPLYMGIQRPTAGLAWHGYRVLRRLLSLTGAKAWKTLLYLARLRARAARRHFPMAAPRAAG